MQIRRINGKKYREPTHLRDVPLGRLIEYSKHEDGIRTASAILRDPKAYRWQKIQFFRVVIEAISIVSGIPAKAIEEIKNPFDRDFNLYGEFALLFKYYFEFFGKLEYQQNTSAGRKLKLITFKAPNKYGVVVKHKFRLLNLENIRTRQYLFFTEYLGRFMEETANGIKTDLSQLPALISCLAWREKELDIVADKVTGLKEKAYSTFVNAMESRRPLFEHMPSSMAYRCLDYFFLNCRQWPISIRNYSGRKTDSSTMQKSSISATTV